MTDPSGKVNAGIAFNIQGLSDSSNFDRAKSWIDKAHAASLLTCLRAADDMNEVRKMFELRIDYYPIEINGGNVEKMIHSRSKGGRVCNLELILTDEDLLPTSIDVSNSAVITGQKKLILYCEAPTDTSDWDEVMFAHPAPEPGNDTSSLPEFVAPIESNQTINIDTEDNSANFMSFGTPVTIIFTAIVLIVMIMIVLSQLRKNKNDFYQKT